MFLFWPAILFILLALVRIVEAIFPCHSGLFIGGCVLGNWFLSVLAFESFVVYTILSLAIYIIFKQLGKSVSKIVVIILGLASLGFVFGSVFFVAPVFFRFFTLPVFYGIDLFSKVKFPLPPSIILYYGEGFTAWQRLIKLFFFPFFPDFPT